ncbi:MAG TPA: hypothetical protein DDW94_07140 [Deltaproteobacteria bacterium]|nr:MAG: hypothetical protein A2Z79_01670 [Deltaproteobacteria bacterium GWA2_55_82]OGQ62011.1 MAG: hypothetical protein A3I81_03535 [Deltaproteobacteria bacterium RIFCSPLOWO2_02_FULL_55_12]HBG46749.1 hypothetical protein [Deltaproteobacteria bacterium]HCY11242.1 hypothetical protein [Deltaproteobacteria bacterium]
MLGKETHINKLPHAFQASQSTLGGGLEENPALNAYLGDPVYLFVKSSEARLFRVNMLNKT